MLGCFETLITGAEILLRVLVIIFIPCFICGTLTAVSEGSLGDPCVFGIIIFYSVVLLVALRRVF